MWQGYYAKKMDQIAHFWPEWWFKLFTSAYRGSPPPAVFQNKYQSYKYERNTAGKSATLAAAREAWWAAARACDRATAAGPRWRRRRRWQHSPPVAVEVAVGVEDVEVDSVGGAGLVAISSFTFVLPPTVATDKVACPPAFSILWKTSNKRVSSSPIFASESEE